MSIPKYIVGAALIVLAGTSHAAGWRSLRIDGSSEASFAKSIAALQEKLSPAHRYVFDSALEDIEREYTADEYRRQLDGLRYKQVVRLVDATGETARRRYQAATRPPNRGAGTSYRGPAFTAPPIFQQRPPANDRGQRGVTDTPR
jgi:hypothetical protein